MVNSITLLRNATLLLRLAGKTILVDPMLGKKGSMDPMPMTANGNRNPMVDLPIREEQLKEQLASVDFVIITHTHPDHWDAAAQRLLDKRLPLLCQPEDKELLRSQGFTNIREVGDRTGYAGLEIIRTPGQHGTGEIGKMMAPVSGFVLSDGNHRLYLAGDTIWYEEVKQTLKIHEPDTIIVNAGAAQFVQGDPITMTIEDVLTTAQAAPQAQVLAVHMEAVNHCYLTREELQLAIQENELQNRIFVPADGETILLKP